MKKGSLLVLAMTLFIILCSFVYAAEEALTPEKLCGVWEGNLLISFRDNPTRFSCNSKLLITQNLNGFFAYTMMGSRSIRLLDVPGEIVNDQLLMRDRVTIKVKVKMNAKNMLEGEATPHSITGDLTKFKKVRDLTNEEKQLPLEDLKKLVE
jgi:hypothetical protein